MAHVYNLAVQDLLDDLITNGLDTESETNPLTELRGVINTVLSR